MALDLEWLGHEFWVLIWESESHERRGVGWHLKLYNEYNGSSSMATTLFKISLQCFLHFWFLWFWPNMSKKRKAKRQGLYKVHQENEIRNHILPLDLELQWNHDFISLYRLCGILQKLSNSLPLPVSMPFVMCLRCPLPLWTQPCEIVLVNGMSVDVKRKKKKRRLCQRHEEDTPRPACCTRRMMRGIWQVAPVIPAKAIWQSVLPNMSISSAETRRISESNLDRLRRTWPLQCMSNKS